MPITSEPDLPIRYVQIGGPAVEALDRRKENSSNPHIAAAELRDSYNDVKGDLFAGIKALAQAVSGPMRR
ncbi:MAG: hypothetical protein WAU53_13095 [Rhodoplanes sp.]